MNVSFPFLALFYRNFNFDILRVSLTEKMHNIDGNKCLYYTTLNIHIILMKCIREFKFGMMIHQYRFYSFVYSMTPYDSDRNLQAKSRKHQGVFEVKSRVKTWQVRGIWSQQMEHKQVSQWGTEPGVRKGKRSLLACHTRCKCSMETTHNR